MSFIHTVPNQWVIKVNKSKIDQDTTYTTNNIDALNNAAKNLKAGAFKLWVYFAKNQDGYTFALSPQDVKNTFGMNKTQYDNARQELEQKGYLIVQDRNYYYFSEIPQPINIDERKKRKFKDSFKYTDDDMW